MTQPTCDRHSEQDPGPWEFHEAVLPRVSGVTRACGYRALAVPDEHHLGLPSSRLTVILSVGDGLRCSFQQDQVATVAPRPLLIAGLHTRPSHVQQNQGQAGIQLAIHPLAARRLLGRPSAEIAELDVDGDQVWGRATRRLHDRVSADQRWDRTFGAVDSFLVGCLSGTEERPIRPELAAAWRLLERSRGRVPIRDLASSVGLTTRRLSTLFTVEFGHSPKTIAQLMRFELAVSLLRQQHAARRLDLAAVSAVAGFADQAHLSREFRRFSGLSPAAWVSAELGRPVAAGG